MKMLKKIVFSLAIVFATLLQINTASAQTEEVYITKSGGKYHKKDCAHIKGNGNLTAMELGKAKTGKYDACKGCFGGVSTKTTTKTITKTTPTKTTTKTTDKVVDKTKMGGK